MRDSFLFFPFGGGRTKRVCNRRLELLHFMIVLRFAQEVKDEDL